MKTENSSKGYQDGDSAEDLDHNSNINLKNVLHQVGHKHHSLRNLINIVDEHGYSTNERSAADFVGETDNLLD